MKQKESDIGQVPVACDTKGVPAGKRERWIETAIQVYDAVVEVRELPNGWSFRLPNDQATLLLLAEYVSLDRMCCTFLDWHIEVKANDGPVWLHLVGSQAVKELTKTNFESMPLLKEEVALAAGFSIANRKPLDEYTKNLLAWK